MSANEKTEKTIELLEYLEVACQNAARAKDPVMRFIAAEREVQLASERKRLQASLTQPDLGLAPEGS